MSASNDWIFIAVFFGAFSVVTVGEVYWLVQRLAVPLKKALTTVLLPNFITITLGFFVTFIIFGFLLAFAVEENAGGGGAGTWAVFIAALGFPFLLMATIRRLLIGGLRIEYIARPLRYSVISTLIFFAAVFGPPAIFLALR
jgi:hypothetical protein